MPKGQSGDHYPGIPGYGPDVVSGNHSPSAVKRGTDIFYGSAVARLKDDG